MNRTHLAATLALALGLAATGSMVVAQNGRSSTEGREFSGSDGAGSPSARRKAKRIREGTVINDALGRFVEGNSGAQFVTEDGHEFGGLPNLNLERVVRMLKDTEDSDKLIWSVSGTITEYSGRNYLLISRAVYKSMALPPIPKAVTSGTASTGR